jgi:ribokinase
VVGNLCWDVIVRGLARIPGWGEEVEGGDSIQAPGGQGYNLAAALAALGVRTELVGIVGTDRAGEAICSAATAAGIRSDHILLDETLPTAVTAAMVRQDGERAFASDFGCQRQYRLCQVCEQSRSIVGARAVCMVGLFNIPGFDLGELALYLREVRADGAVTVLDTGWDALGWPEDRITALERVLAEVDWFLPNLDEARAITGSSEPLRAAGKLHELGPEVVVVKCGAAGSIGAATDEFIQAGVIDVTVRDAVGAGDTFDAGFVAAMLRGVGLGNSLAFASAAAGLRVARDRQDDAWPTRHAVSKAAEAVKIRPVQIEARQ